MASESIARRTLEGDGESRAVRGLGLYREKGSEIVEYLDGTFGVPSRSIADWIYHVDLDRETCDCPDHANRGSICIHIIAATIFAAKRKLKAFKPKPRKVSRFAGDWASGIPSDEWLDRMGGVA